MADSVSFPRDSVTGLETLCDEMVRMVLQGQRRCINCCYQIRHTSGGCKRQLVHRHCLCRLTSLQHWLHVLRQRFGFLLDCQLRKRS